MVNPRIQRFAVMNTNTLSIGNKCSVTKNSKSDFGNVTTTDFVSVCCFCGESAGPEPSEENRVWSTWRLR